MTTEPIAYCLGFYKKQWGTDTLLFLSDADDDEFITREIGQMGYDVVGITIVDPRFPGLFWVHVTDAQAGQLKSQFESHPQFRLLS